MLSPFFFELVNHLESQDVQFSWKDNTNRRLTIQDHQGPERRKETEEFQAIYKNEVLASQEADEKFLEAIEAVVNQTVMNMRARGLSMPFMDS